jgi:hypothetical protein
MLAVSGDLDEARPRPHPFPPIGQWSWTQHNAFKAVYPTQQRSVYLMTQRLIRHPMLSLFDGPDTNTSTDVRSRSTVPLQSLYLMNNPFVQDRARSFADRMRRNASGQREAVSLAYRWAYGRAADPAEVEHALAYLERFASEAERSGLSRAEANDRSWASLARLLMTSNEFLYID